MTPQKDSVCIAVDDECPELLRQRNEKIAGESFWIGVGLAFLIAWALGSEHPINIG